MRLSELVASLTPSDYTQLALILFVGVFIGVLFRHGGSRRRDEHRVCAALPLVEDAEPKKGDAS